MYFKYKTSLFCEQDLQLPSCCFGPFPTPQWMLWLSAQSLLLASPFLVKLLCNLEKNQIKCSILRSEISKECPLVSEGIRNGGSKQNWYLLTSILQVKRLVFWHLKQVVLLSWKRRFITPPFPTLKFLANKTTTLWLSHFFRFLPWKSFREKSKEPCPQAGGWVKMKGVNAQLKTQQLFNVTFGEPLYISWQLPWTVVACSSDCFGVSKARNGSNDNRQKFNR